MRSSVTWRYNTETMPRKRKIGQETIGPRLWRLRKEREPTQKELAQKIGIGHTLISDYETGRLMLNGEMVARLTLTLGVSADTILGLKPKERDVDTQASGFCADSRRSRLFRLRKERLF